MTIPKGLEWNQNQLKIAAELSKGKTVKEIIAEGEFKEAAIYKVKNAIDAGDKPPSLDEAYIASAPPPSKIWQPKPAKPKEDKQAPATVTLKGIKGGPPLTQALSETSYLQFIPQAQQVPLTPTIFISYMCALKNGYEGGMADWLSLVSLDFWQGRNRDMFAEVSGIRSDN